jgi:hypothetical protein
MSIRTTYPSQLPATNQLPFPHIDPLVAKGTRLSFLKILVCILNNELCFFWNFLWFISETLYRIPQMTIILLIINITFKVLTFSISRNKITRELLEIHLSF